MNADAKDVVAADVAVVGGGAAGLMAAVAAAEAGAAVVVCEQLDRPGAKLLATGGGRCNLTNQAAEAQFLAAFGRHGRFAAPALAAMDAAALREFFDGLGVPTACPDGVHVYPQSNRAADVRDALVRRCGELNVKVLTGAAVQSLLLSKAGAALTGVVTRQGAVAAPRVILACGGRSYPELGGTGGGYELARQAGHEIVEPTPALVPLVAQEPWCRTLAGLSLTPARIWIDVPAAKKSPGARPAAHAPRRREITGDVLFTHTGISGPAVLDLSGDVAVLLGKQPWVTVRLDLAPSVSTQDWLDLFERWQHSAGTRTLRPLLAQRLPETLARLACRLARIHAEMTAAHLPLPQRRELAELLTGLPLTITATEGFAKAMVTRGGVSLAEVNPRTLESRKLAGLFLAGEVLDLDGPCGGYNLQWAFSSGHLAGRSAAG